MEVLGQQTANVIKYFDNLFDSLNGGGGSDPGKPLKGPVRKNSLHLSFWKDSIANLKNMHFQREGSREKLVPPSLKNFILTIEGFVDLSNVLLLRIPYFFARSFNQDPLENYFGQMRQHRGRHINPMCSQFVESYKALLVRSICSVHSVASNCEETFETNLIQLKDLIAHNNKRDVNNYIESLPIYKQIAAIPSAKLARPLNKAAMSYISGFVAKQVLKKFNCDYCRIHILELQHAPQSVLRDHTYASVGIESSDHEFTSAKEYNPSKQTLIYCNSFFRECIFKSYNIAQLIIANHHLKFKRNLKRAISYYIMKCVYFSFVCDHKEKLISLIINCIVDVCIFTFCKRINHIINGKCSKISPNSCVLLKQAKTIWEKRRKYSN